MKVKDVVYQEHLKRLKKASVFEIARAHKSSIKFATEYEALSEPNEDLQHTLRLISLVQRS